MRQILIDAVETALAKEFPSETRPLEEDRARLLALSAELDSDLFQRLKIYCFERRISVRQLLEHALRTYLGLPG